MFLDADSGAGVGSCTGTPCPKNVSNPWADNGRNPRERHFRAELRAAGGAVVAQSEVTVEVRKFVWNISLAAESPTGVVKTQPVRFNATVDRSVYGTGYQIYMYEDGTPFYSNCSSGTGCNHTIYRNWADNPAPQPGRVHVEVRRGSDVAGASEQLVVPFRRFLFTVDLAFSTVTGANGNPVHKATATSSYSVYGTGYRLKIKKADCTEVCSSASGTGCGPTTISVCETYRAVVQDTNGNIFGDSGAWTLTADGPRQEVIDDVDLAHLASLFASTSSVCNALAEYPGSHLMEPPSTLSDQYRICVASANAGKTKVDVLRDIATGIGGAAALGGLWYLQREGVRLSPPPGTPWTPDDVKAPRPVPLPLLPRICNGH